MCQDAMFKAAATNQPVNMGKSLNLLDLQLYARSEQEKHAPILAQNLAEDNQWLEESALENDTTSVHNFSPLKIPRTSLLIWRKKRIQYKKIIQMNNTIQANKNQIRRDH